MLCDDGSKVYVGSLIFRSFLGFSVKILLPAVSKETKLEKAASAIVSTLVTVLSYAEVLAVNVKDLTKLVVIVGAGTAKLEADAARSVLDVELTVDVAVFIGGHNLGLEDLCTGNHNRLSVLLVQRLKVCDGGIYLIVHIGRDKGNLIRLAERDNRLPFFYQTPAGNECRKGGDCNNRLSHNS